MLDPLLGAERRLAEDVVVRERVFGLDAQRRIECLPLARDLDPAGAKQREHEEADGFELPPERRVRELVHKISAAGHVSVTAPLFDPRHHLRKRSSVGPECRPALFVSEES